MEHHQHQPAHPIPSPSFKNWLPLIAVVSVIVLLIAAQISLNGYSFYKLMSFSMGYFFVIFALFKLIDIPGFAEGYSKYDLIAMRWKPWGYVVPFIELGLGLAYLLLINAVWLHMLTLVFSLVVAAGVAIKLAKRETFLCACLGTVLKVPLTKVSLVEYALMAVMALLMLF